MHLSETKTTANETVSRRDDFGRPSIERLIAQLQETAEILEGEVRGELERSPTMDPADPSYPLLARSMGLRLSNLRSTLATLLAMRSGEPKAA